MKTPAEYEQEIADRDRMIAKLRDQLTAALDEIVRITMERKTEKKDAA